MKIVPKSANYLHWILLNSVLKSVTFILPLETPPTYTSFRAPLSFFASTDSGDLVNRCSILTKQWHFL